MPRASTNDLYVNCSFLGAHLQGLLLRCLSSTA
jgi:hypothetical protein